MTVRIDQAAAVKIARQLAAQGRELPPEMRSNPQLVHAYDQAQAEAAGGTSTKAAPTGTTEATPKARTSKQAPHRRPRRGTASTSGGRRKATTNRRSLLQAPAGVRMIPGAGGDAGGLMLALVLYPLALSVIKWGAAGPSMWFRAKWLNETVVQPDNLAPVLDNAINGQPAPHLGGTPNTGGGLIGIGGATLQLPPKLPPATTTTKPTTTGVST